MNDMNAITNSINMPMALNCFLVQQHLPQFKMVRVQEDEAYFEGWVSGEQNGIDFQLRLYFNPLLPEVCPALYVWAPLIVPRMPSGSVNEVGSSHAFHTLSNGPEGRVQICHTAPSDWDASVTYVLPLLKGNLWCVAHSAHMQDGSSISGYFM